MTRITLKYSDQDEKVAKFIHDTIIKTVNIKPPNMKKWSNEVRLMRERDGYSHKQITDAIICFSQDKFWSTTCTSVSGLRKHFDKAKALQVKNKDSGESLDQYRSQS